jgi:hypothetical protein
MNLPQLIKNIEIFVAQWGGTTVPRIGVAFLGVLICVWIGIALWERRIRIVGAVLGLVAGLFMIVAAIDPRIVHFLADTSFLTRIRILMTVVSFVVVVVTVEAIRRSHLQERYAILWVTTGLIILVTAFFPSILDLFSLLLGTQYVTSVVAIVFTFLLLIAFHFSIALTGFQKKQAQIAQRFAILEARIEELSAQVAALNPGPKSADDRVVEEEVSAKRSLSQSPGDMEGKTPVIGRFSGPQISAMIIIGISFLAVLTVGLITPQAMIGDEVTHYYMLADQSKNLSQPNFYAHIPAAWGDEDVRRYPHSCLWHYLGAIVYRMTGGSIYAVQIYQALFWLQFLWMAFLVASAGRRNDSYSPVLYLLVLASLPVSLIFAMAFYQDVPMVAQVLTACYLLWRRHWFWASCFMALAVGMKISALVFLPAFLVMMGVWEFRRGTWRRAVTALMISAVLLGGFTWGMGWMVEKYAGGGFYPVEQLHKMATSLKSRFETSKDKGPGQPNVAQTSEKAQLRDSRTVTPYEVQIIANHPGDLRIPENYFVYGGGILWLVLIVGGGAMIHSRYRSETVNGGAELRWWLFGIGLWFIVVSAYFLRSAPDARFFLPGISLVMLPFVEGVVRLPRPKIIISIVAAMAILQGGHVLKKTYNLRNVSPEIREAIVYLQQHPVKPPKIFMYPEGNYRLFPYPHDWYLEYRLREFWKGNNDVRLKMLRQFKIGAVVIKRHLIADVDEAITNLGVYPTYFVRDLEKDRRFAKLFENRDVVIYRVP